VKPIAVNLASRPFRNNLVVGLLVGGIGVALVGGTAYNLYVYLSYGASYARLQHDQAEDRVRIATLQAEEKRLAQEVKSRNFKQAYERGKIANDLIRKSAFSWTALFNTLETVVPPDVVMTAIRPNITGDGIVLRIEGVAKNSEAFRKLQDSLLRHPSFAKVFPSNEKHLNPNLPDVTFLLTCDYVPPAAVPPVVTAQGDAAAAAPADAATPAVPAPAPSDTASGAPATPAPGPAAAPAGSATVTAQAAGGPKGAAVAAGTVVGRDGQPVGPPRETVAAPGGLALASFVPLQPHKGKHATSATAASTTPAGASTANSPKPAVPGTTMARKSRTAKGAAGASAPAATDPANDPAIQAARARMTGARGYDPNVPRTMPPALQAAATRPKPEPPPAAAQRLDLPLKFVGRPAAEVYQKLAQAHGVSIELDPSIDPKTPVTVNLQGRTLDVALKLLAGLLHTSVAHRSDGNYRIASTEVLSPAASPPPIEEDLPPNNPPPGGQPPVNGQKPPATRPQEGQAP
jgi:hypothetical protein